MFFRKRVALRLLCTHFPLYTHFSLTNPYLIEGSEGFEEKFTNRWSRWWSESKWKWQRRFSGISLFSLSISVGSLRLVSDRCCPLSNSLKKEKERKEKILLRVIDDSEIPQGKILHGKNYRPRLVGETMVENIGSNLVETVSSLSRISRIE